MRCKANKMCFRLSDSQLERYERTMKRLAGSPHYVYTWSDLITLALNQLCEVKEKEWAAQGLKVGQDNPSTIVETPAPEPSKDPPLRLVRKYGLEKYKPKKA